MTISYRNVWSGATVERDISRYTHADITALANCLSDEEAEEIHNAMPANATPQDWLMAAKRILPDSVFDAMMCG
jgi:hypothetical protein